MASKFAQTNLQKTNPVQATSRINEKGETIIYWTDGVNPPRFYNIDADESFDSADELNIFPVIKKDIDLTIDSISDADGSLVSGAYQFAARYVDKDGNTTNFTTITRPVNVVRGIQKDAGDGYFNQGNPTAPTSKSIKLSINDIDTSYDRVQLAVIRYEGAGIASVEYIEPLSIVSSTFNYTVTGGESFTDGSIQEILIDNAYYTAAKSLTQVDNTLYLGNLTQDPAVRYQRYANNIKVRAVTKELGVDENYQWAYGDENLTYFNKSFKRGEVYAFYISFTLENGQQTRAFHIPGRESEVVGGGAEDSVAVFNAGFTEAKTFQLNSTAGSYNMSYWENENERYPSTEDWDITNVNINGSESTAGTLRNKKVRHHKFPDHVDNPIAVAPDAGGENTSVSVLGIKLENINLPDNLRDKVKSINIYHAKKTLDNTLVVDQGWAQPNEPFGTDSRYINQEYINSASLNVDINAFSVVPFSTMLRDTSVASISYVKALSKAKITRTEAHDVNDDEWSVHLMDQEYMTPVNAKVRAISRIPSNKDEVRISNLGFTEDKESTEEESQILVEVDNDWGTYRYGINETYVGQDHGIMVGLMQYKTEVFAPFDLQELVPVGSYSGNMDIFQPSTATDTKASGSIEVTSAAPAGTGSWANVTIEIGPNDSMSYDIQFGDTRADIISGLANSYSGANYTVQALEISDFETVETYVAVFAKEFGAEWNYIITETSTTDFNTISTITGMENGANATNDLTFFGGDTFINKYGYRIGVGQSPKKHVVNYVLVESTDNIAFRQAGQNYGEINGNKFSVVEDLLALEENNPDTNSNEWFDNYFEYDEAHSAGGELAVKTTPFPKVFDEVYEFPDRVVRGQSDTDNVATDTFRKFLAEDYLDLPKNRGEITNLDVLQNILLVHMERGLFRTRGREELTTSDFRAFLGSGDIFSVKPDEMFSIEEGYAGLQNAKSAISTSAGYFFVDQQAKKVFLITDKPKEISDLGLRNFFSRELEWYIDDIQDGISKDIVKTDIFSSYDPKYKRIIFTKRDWKPTTELLNQTLTTAGGELLVNSTPADYTNETYFEDKSFTISFLPELGRWVSFHSYEPDYMFNDINNMYSYKNGEVHIHDSGNPSEYYGTQEDMIYEFVDNREPKQTKLVRNVEFITYASQFLEGSRIDHKKTFDAIRITNELQDTGYVDLIYFTEPGGNKRNSGHTWKVNKFRDVINPNTGNPDPNMPFYRKKKLTGKYAVVRLYYTPEDAHFLRLIDSDVNFRKHNR